MLFYFNLILLCRHAVPETQETPLADPRWRLDPSFQVSCSVLMFYYLIISFFSFIFVM